MVVDGRHGAHGQNLLGDHGWGVRQQRRSESALACCATAPEGRTFYNRCNIIKESASRLQFVMAHTVNRDCILAPYPVFWVNYASPRRHNATCANSSSPSRKIRKVAWFNESSPTGTRRKHPHPLVLPSARAIIGPATCRGTQDPTKDSAGHDTVSVLRIHSGGLGQQRGEGQRVSVGLEPSRVFLMCVSNIINVQEFGRSQI